MKTLEEIKDIIVAVLLYVCAFILVFVIIFGVIALFILAVTAASATEPATMTLALYSNSNKKV